MKHFASETPRQRAKHAEIARRYGPRRLSRFDGPLFRRRRELVNAGQWRLEHDPEWVPDPFLWAAAIADVVFFLCGDADIVVSLAHDAGVKIRKGIAEAALDDVAARRPARPMNGARAGKLVGLTCEQRLDCGITTMAAIDETRSERRQRVLEGRRERQRLDKRKKRAAARVVSPLSQEAAQPWAIEGVSRSTWYRRRKGRETSRVGAKYCQGSPDQSPGNPLSQRETEFVGAPFIDSLLAADEKCPTLSTKATTHRYQPAGHIPVSLPPAPAPEDVPRPSVNRHPAEPPLAPPEPDARRLVGEASSRSTPWAADTAKARWLAMSEGERASHYARWQQAFADARSLVNWRAWIKARETSSDPNIVADEALRIVAIDARIAATRQRLVDAMPETVRRMEEYFRRHAKCGWR